MRQIFLPCVLVYCYLVLQVATSFCQCYIKFLLFFFLSFLVFWILMIHCCKLLIGSEIYQETLAKALAKHFGARLLIVDSLLLPGVSFSDFTVQFASFSRIYFLFLRKYFCFRLIHVICWPVFLFRSYNWYEWEW